MIVIVDLIKTENDEHVYFKYFFDLYSSIFSEALDRNLESISLPILSDGDCYRQYFPDLIESFFDALKEFQIEQANFFSRKKTNEDKGIRTALKSINLVNNQEIHEKYLIPYLKQNGKH